MTRKELEGSRRHSKAMEALKRVVDPEGGQRHIAAREVVLAVGERALTALIAAVEPARQINEGHRHYQEILPRPELFDQDKH